MPNDHEEDPLVAAQPNAQQMRAILEKSSETFRKCGELFEANQQELSKLLFARYKALLAAGFNDQQAMSIVVSRGLG